MLSAFETHQLGIEFVKKDEKVYLKVQDNAFFNYLLKKLFLFNLQEKVSLTAEIGCLKIHQDIISLIQEIVTEFFHKDHPQLRSDKHLYARQDITVSEKVELKQALKEGKFTTFEGKAGEYLTFTSNEAFNKVVKLLYTFFEHSIRVAKNSHTIAVQDKAKLIELMSFSDELKAKSNLSTSL